MIRYAPPVHRSLWALAAAGFLGTLLTDLVYWRTADFLWVDASDWLVAAGVVAGFVALVAALVESLAFSHRYAPSASFAVAALCAWILGVFDMLVHTRDSWTSVVPWGAALSAATVLVLILAYGLARVEPREPRSQLPAEPVR